MSKYLIMEHITLDNNELTDRDLEEIKHALFYAVECGHGTVDHNLLILVAKLAGQLGMSVRRTPGVDGQSYYSVVVPGDVDVERAK